MKLIKSLKIKFFYILFVIASPFIFFFGCGTPNPLETNSILNAPFGITINSSNNNMLIFNVNGLNSTSNAASFDGYNIYYGISEDRTLLMANKILSPYDSSSPFPTIALSTSFTEQSISFILSNRFYYSNKNNTVSLEENIIPYSFYYFIIESSDRNNSQTRQQRILYKHIPFQQLNQSTAQGIIYSNQNLTLIFYSNYILPQGSTTIQNSGYTTTWYNTQTAPTRGYTSTGVPLFISNMYMFKTISDYGFIYITDNNTTTTSFHICYQRGSTNL